MYVYFLRIGLNFEFCKFLRYFLENWFRASGNCVHLIRPQEIFRSYVKSSFQKKVSKYQ